MAVSKKKKPQNKKKKAPKKKERKKKQTYIHTHKSTHAIVVWHIAAKKGRFSRLTSGFLCVNLEWWWWWEEEEGRWRFHLLAYSLFCVCTHPTHKEQTSAHTQDWPTRNQFALQGLCYFPSWRACLISKAGKVRLFLGCFSTPDGHRQQQQQEEEEIKKEKYRRKCWCPAQNYRTDGCQSTAEAWICAAN